MKIIPTNIPDHKVVKMLVRQANTGTWDGSMMLSPYFLSCSYYWEKYEATMFFTRDVGHHESGWWKNPDYERCFHLSLSFVDRLGNDKPHDSKKAEKIVKLVFGANHKLVWCEPPYSKIGLNLEVWHYRLFCNKGWIAIKPRGEVYSKDFTPAGWKSFSEVQAFNRKV